MGKTLGTLALIIGGILGIDLLIKSTSAKSLNFVIAKANLDTSNILSPVIQLVINIQNPTSVQYRIDAIVGNFYINDTLTGNVSSFISTNILAASQTAYPVNVALQPGAVINDIVSLFNGSQQLDLRLAGTANADGLLIPFDIKYSLV